MSLAQIKHEITDQALHKLHAACINQTGLDIVRHGDQLMLKHHHRYYSINTGMERILGNLCNETSTATNIHIPAYVYNACMLTILNTLRSRAHGESFHRLSAGLKYITRAFELVRVETTDTDVHADGSEEWEDVVDTIADNIVDLVLTKLAE